MTPGCCCCLEAADAVPSCVFVEVYRRKKFEAIEAAVDVGLKSVTISKMLIHKIAKLAIYDL